MAEVLVGIGSNLGDREENIAEAIRLLRERMRLMNVSSIYETEPMYVKEQPWFLNCVAIFEAQVEPEEVLGFLKTVELRMGRKRGVLYGPRKIDLDILFFDERVIDSDSLKIPHPRLQERRFVLLPLAEICPDRVHPVLGLTVGELSRSLESSEVVRKTGA